MRRRIGIELRRFWYAHRWPLAAAIVGLPLLATMVHSAVGGTEPRTRPPSRVEACRAARAAANDIARRYPETPRESLEVVVRQACSRAPIAAPTAVASAPSPSPGCHMLGDTDRRHPARVRSAEPSRPVPFFARRSGRLPDTGTPRVGGVQLPAGSRCGPFWSTDAGVPDAVELAGDLAAAFPATGLWPVLWPSAGAEPDPYIARSRSPERVDPLDAETILRRAWLAKRRFPGPAAAEPAARWQDFDPFGDVLEASMTQPSPGGPLLLLVPVNRPADVLAVLGTEKTEYFTDEELSSVLRSWEERFGAVLTTVDAAGVGLVVGAPPRDDEQVRRLAAEQETFAPDSWTATELERLLRSPRRMRGVTSADYWAFGWPD